jgi:hypothetical protein
MYVLCVSLHTCVHTSVYLCSLDAWYGSLQICVCLPSGATMWDCQMSSMTPCPVQISVTSLPTCDELHQEG